MTTPLCAPESQACYPTLSLGYGVSVKLSLTFGATKYKVLSSASYTAQHSLSKQTFFYPFFTTLTNTQVKLYTSDHTGMLESGGPGCTGSAWSHIQPQAYVCVQIKNKRVTMTNMQCIYSYPYSGGLMKVYHQPRTEEFNSSRRTV